MYSEVLHPYVHRNVEFLSREISLRERKAAGYLMARVDLNASGAHAPPAYYDMCPADFEAQKTILAFAILPALGGRISSSEFIIVECLPLWVFFRVVIPCRKDLVRTLLVTVTTVRHTQKHLQLALRAATIEQKELVRPINSSCRGR